MNDLKEILNSISVNQLFYSLLIVGNYRLLRSLIRYRLDVYTINIDGEAIAIGSVPMIVQSFGYSVTIPNYYLDRARTNRFILTPRDFVIGRYYDAKVAVRIKGHRFLVDFDDEIEINLCV